ncbi:MAG TPA: hypothetical protein VL860_00755, partial [Planctomycetota bacterium]|nr:hypothetical protein [Planctomycetota bacterium]
VLDAATVSSEEMLKTGLTMIESRWKEIQKTRGGKAVPMPGAGSDAGTGGGNSNAALQAFLKGTNNAPPAGGTATGQPATPGAGDKPVVTASGFNPERITALRTEAISRVTTLLKTKDPIALSLMVEKEPQEVTLLPSDPAVGLQIKLGYGTKKTLAWNTLDTGTLGELLYVLTGNGETASPTLGTDLMFAALCNFVANRPVQAAEQVEKLGKIDPDLQEQYQERAHTMK